MYPVSERWNTEMRRSHTVDFKAQLFRQGEQIADDIPIVTGSVFDTASAIFRKRCTLSLLPSSAVMAMIAKDIPSNGGLWPTGNEIKVLAGLIYEDGLSEYVPLGMFRTSRIEVLGTEDQLIVGLEGWDRGRAISRARFVTPYHVKQGTNYAVAIKDLVKSRAPWLGEDDFEFADTTYTTPNLVFSSAQDDPWEIAQNMAMSIGMDLLFDGNGKCVMRPLPNPYSSPSVFDYEEGEECTMTEITRNLSDETAYNGVIATGESSTIQAPVRGEAWDIDPNSPTYYDPQVPEASVYGAVPYFMTSPLITTNAQAKAAANGNLGAQMGILEAMTMRAVTNYAHESFDAVKVKRSITGIDDLFIMGSLEMGLGVHAQMSASGFKRRVALVND